MFISSNTQFNPIQCEQNFHESQSFSRIVANPTLVDLRCLRGLICFFATLIFAAGAAAAAGQTITVDTLEDITDFGGARQVQNLPGPDGRISFREACAAANNTSGPQTIKFAIPAAEWWLYDDRALLKLEDGPFSITDDETTIDFTSQTEFTGDTNPNGWEVGVYGLEANGWGVAAIFILADNCTIKGLDRVMQRGYGIEVRRNNNRVISCTISGSLYAGVKVQGDVDNPATGNIIGGTMPGEGNVLSGGNAGLRIDGPVDGTIVIGNKLVGSPYAGVQVRGAYCCPDYTPFNTRIGGPTPEERNWIANNGKYGEEGFPEGDQVQVEWAVGTLVEGNYIGTTEDGSLRFPNAHGTVGVGVRESDNTVIRHNLISGIRKIGVNHAAGQTFGAGISIHGPNTGVVIEENQIGSDATGQNPVPNLYGISFSWLQGYASGAKVGGPEASDGNLVAFNERVGIIVVSGVDGVTIERNSIHSNGMLGIDLLTTTGQAGPTQNDPLDRDTGGNGLQNFPEILTADNNGQTIHVVGQLNSEPLNDYTLEFFASPECDPSGFGQGQMFLGSTSVSTDAAGNAAFDVSLSATVQDGWVITSTATLEPIGSTSEFSACVLIESETLTQVASDSYNVLRGVFVSGTLADTFDSDDSYLKFKPGITLNSFEPPVWLEFVGTLPSEAPTSLSVTLEAQANTLGLTQSIDMFNWNSGQYEPVDSGAASFNVDSIATVDLTAFISDYVQAGTGSVKTRMGWCATGPVLLYPWTVSINQVFWSYH